MKHTDGIKSFILKHSLYFSLFILGAFCYLFLFFQLGAYPLIDIDETRYVAIAKAMWVNSNWITPMLNNVPFLEKPPLYFWLTVFVYKIFGVANEFTSRFSTALLGTFAVFATYFFGRKTIGQAFGLISAFIMLSNIWFLIFTHVAILDLGFMAFTMASIFSVLLTLFCKRENIKFCWWSGWFFMAFAVLMKGLIGIIVPVIVVFFSLLATKRLKEAFRPVNWILGLIIFTAICAPWHYNVWLEHGNVWINEYLVKHHFARFLDSSMGLGRKQPFLFYVPVILLGFMPWTISLLATFISGIKTLVRDIKATKRIKPIFSTDTNDRKILVTMSIYFLVTFLFFSISSSKLPTYALVMFPPLALLCGYYWWGYISCGKFTRGIVISTVSTSAVFTIGAIAGVCAPHFTAMPLGIETFMSFSAGWLIIISLISLLCLLSKNRSLLFVSNIVMMLGIIIIATSRIFPFITTLGQNELEKFANESNAVRNSTLITFDFPAKYSILHIKDTKSGEVIFITDENFNELNTVLKAAQKKSLPVYVIVKNKNFENYKEKLAKYTMVEKGNKYTLLVKY